MRLTSLFLAGFALAAGSGAAAADRPLTNLAKHVPAQWASDIVLVDLEAARAETKEALAPLLLDSPETDGERLSPDLLPFSYMLLDGPYSRELLARENSFESEMGFSLTDIDAIASWGKLPEEQAVFIGTFDEDAVSAALSARNFGTEERKDQTVFFRGEDHKMGLPRDDAFSHIGKSSRFAVRCGALFFARSWAMMERMLEQGQSLGEEADTAALFEALHAADMGVPIQIFIPSTGHLPVRERTALVQWQDRATLTGGIVRVFTGRADAEQAAAEAASWSGQVLPYAKRTVEEVLMADAEIRIVDAADRSVLLVTFSVEADLAAGNPIHALRNTPYLHLIGMYMKRDLEALFSAPGISMLRDLEKSLKAD